jgi:mono/diheme cytochrome c family protein
MTMIFVRILMMPTILLALAPFTLASGEELSSYDGKQLYFRFCAACHGEQAEGNGPVASYFKIAPPDLTRLAKRRGGTYPADEVRKTIDGRSAASVHGSRQMPVWGYEFYFADTGNPDKQTQVEELIDRLVEYLRTVQVK